MFDLNKNKDQNFAAGLKENTLENKNNAGIISDAKEAIDSGGAAPIYDLSGLKIHAMPDKFLSGNKKTVVMSSGENGKASSSGFKKNVLVGVIIGVLIICLLALAGWFLIKSLESPQPEIPAPIVLPEEPPVAPLATTTASTTEPQNLGCSTENCALCDEEECKELSEFCHWADLCEEESKEICPQFTCLTGKKEIMPENDDNAILTPAKDSDQDGLTDSEEGLWGTDPLNNDSDGDTYLDGAEIINLYSPLIAAGNPDSKLIDQKTVKNFINNQYGYSLFYPASWQTSTLYNNAEAITFTSNTGEFFEVLVAPNSDNYATAKEWYAAQNPDVPIDNLTEILIGNWSGVQSLDKLNVYIVKDNYIYTIIYNVGLKNELLYQTTFDMLLKSFHFFESPLN